MMTSLFSSFDPTSKNLQMNWMIMCMPMIMTPMSFWMKNSRWNKLKAKLEKMINKEMKNNTKHEEMMLLTISIFTILMISNLMGLLPYVFTPTSHLCISLNIALPTWMMLMIYGWMKTTNMMFLHLLPTGTPTPIMPMMIMIETIGNIIRPISLSVRLSANMIAGHLLMTLLGNMNESLILLTMPAKMIMMLFESAISIIQAYVFVTLMSLYSSEIT
uniref:ATP synthase F0 subunit 6 n=1 Tax=Euhemisphaerius bistriatus TaxID=3081096 RepID=UPI002E75F154|nr:ATP synthase F0 subunit 6 [Epyhemisphaerius bistriatus]WQB38521.1 ATP synthase F0 subunit 6 [Epyhemisphaerius bistriatus]